MLIPVELSRIVIRDNSEQQYIYISETDGLRGFPIIIGSYEANEINRKVSEVETPRPMTHDLIRRILETLDTVLDKIVVCDLRDGTFYAHLYLSRDDRLFKVDCRPSDAIALACALDVPIFVEEHVMDQVGRVEGTEEF